MVEEPISTTTSVGSATVGSETVSHARTPGPPYVSAFMWRLLSLLVPTLAGMPAARIGNGHDRACVVSRRPAPARG